MLNDNLNNKGKPHIVLANHYRDCLQKYGDSAIGMDWQDEIQNNRRHSVMTDIFRADVSNQEEKLNLLDFACGTSHYYKYLKECDLADKIRYTGIDINHDAISIAKKKYPENTYACLDLLDNDSKIGVYDYIIINGLFTQKRSMSEEQMKNFLIDILISLFSHFTKGLTFNAMSGQVDYRKEEAFHLDLNWIAQIIVNKFGRNFIVRHDYELYENTIYLYKK